MIQGLSPDKTFIHLFPSNPLRSGRGGIRSFRSFIDCSRTLSWMTRRARAGTRVGGTGTRSRRACIAWRRARLRRLRPWGGAWLGRGRFWLRFGTPSFRFLRLGWGGSGLFVRTGWIFWDLFYWWLCFWVLYHHWLWLTIDHFVGRQKVLPLVPFYWSRKKRQLVQTILNMDYKLSNCSKTE